METLRNEYNLAMQKTASQQSNSSIKSTSSSEVRLRTPADFDLGEVLGEGSYSTVYLGTERSKNKQFAIKILDKYHIVKEKKVKYVTIEKDVLNRLNHEFCIKLFYTFQDSKSLFFVLEYCCNGDILGLLNSKGRFDRIGTLFYITEIIEGLRYIHSCSILHRDLKPENILLDVKKHIKITDFGSAKILSEDEQSGLKREPSFVGTAEYCSPELLNRQQTTFGVDVWALGCILYQFLVGVPPFKGGSEYLTFQKILNLDYSIPQSIDSDLTELIKNILVINDGDRFNLLQIIESRVFQNVDWSNLGKRTAPEMEYLEPLVKHNLDPVYDGDEIQDFESNINSVAIEPVELKDDLDCSPLRLIHGSAESIEEVENERPDWAPPSNAFQGLKYGVLKKVSSHLPLEIHIFSETQGAGADSRSTNDL
jgi:3-phosphoinositide dependent protein kinase-1